MSLMHLEQKNKEVNMDDNLELQSLVKQLESVKFLASQLEQQLQASQDEELEKSILHDADLWAHMDLLQKISNEVRINLQLVSQIYPQSEIATESEEILLKITKAYKEVLKRI